MAIDNQALAELRRLVGAENVLTAREDLIPYSFDGTAALKQMPGCVVMAKVESKKGLNNLAQIAQASDAVMAARGDLYTEIDYPHQIAEVMKRIRQVCGDKAVAASRMLGSLLRHPMPSCPDVMDVQYLKEMGYTRFLIGDDICFKKEVLMQAVRIMKAVFA